jgi:hypothetical protein
MEERLANLGLLNYIAIAFLTVTATYGQSTTRALTWAEHPMLSWSDFQGHARRNTGEPSAMTDTGFRVQLECRGGALDIRVAAEFYKNSSWVKAGRKSAELLRHEQGHFDITELYARKMRKAIREARIDCKDDRRAEAAGKRIFEELDRGWEEAEKQYDAETGDGTDLAGQREASGRIGRELAELRGYRLN